MEEDFSLVCQRTDDGDGDVLQASCQEDSFGVTHSSHTLLSPIHHIVAGRWFPCSGYRNQSAKTARELRLRKEVQTTLRMVRDRWAMCQRPI